MPKMSISGQIVSEIIAQLCLENSIQTLLHFFGSTRALSGYLVVVFSGPIWLSLFGADSLSRSVHCAPDENDRPSEQTKIFKLTSVYVPVYISELTRT